MGGFIEPNIHPVLVHFAYALSITALITYVIGRVFPSGRRRESTQSAGDWMLALGAVAIFATIAAGFQAYYTVAHDGPSHAAMTTHRNWAVPSGIAIIGLALWRYRQRSKPPSGWFLSLLTIAALSLSVTAWWGGNIVYKYGLGVQSLPAVTGDGHDHDHGEPATSEAHSDAPSDDDARALDRTTPEHDAGDGHHDVDQPSPDPVIVPEGHDNSDGHHDHDPQGGQ